MKFFFPSFKILSTATDYKTIQKTVFLLLDSLPQGQLWTTDD